MGSSREHAAGRPGDDRCAPHPSPLLRVGSGFARLFSDGATSVLASKFYLDHARHLLRAGDRPGAVDAIGKAIDACPRAREVVIDDDELSEGLL